MFFLLGVFLISVKPMSTENTENKTTPKICKTTVHAVVHVSAVMHILPGYRGTYIGGGGGGYVLSGHCSRQQISVKTEGYLFSEGYLFTGFYGSWCSWPHSTY